MMLSTNDRGFGNCMKMPLKPDSLDKIFHEHINKISKSMKNEEIMDKVREYNSRYIHWDELRYKDLQVDPKIIWALMKLSRRNSSKQFSFNAWGFQYNVINDAQRILHLLDKGAAGMFYTDIDSVDKSGMDRYVISSLMEEAIASSQLEGAATTRRIAKEMLRTKKRPKTRSDQMIINNYNTIIKIRKLKDEKLSSPMILDIHKCITENTLEDKEFEGKYRQDNEIVVADPFEADKIFHQPPDFNEVPSLIDELCNFINNNKEEFFHPLIKAIIIHFLIGYIHPFVDGNGRLARALFYWFALKNGYWLFELMTISKAIKQSRVNYDKSYLYVETDNNDLTYFINYNLKACEKALGNIQNYIKRKHKEQIEAMKFAQENPELNFRQAEILKDLIKHSDRSFSINEIMTKFAVVYQTARSDLLLLNELGYISKRKIGKKFIFRYNQERVMK